MRRKGSPRGRRCAAVGKMQQAAKKIVPGAQPGASIVKELCGIIDAMKSDAGCASMMVLADAYKSVCSSTGPTSPDGPPAPAPAPAPCFDLPGNSGGKWHFPDFARISLSPNDINGCAYFDNMQDNIREYRCGHSGDTMYFEGKANDKCCACGGGSPTQNMSTTAQHPCASGKASVELEGLTSSRKAYAERFGMVYVKPSKDLRKLGIANSITIAFAKKAGKTLKAADPSGGGAAVASGNASLVSVGRIKYDANKKKLENTVGISADELATEQKKLQDAFAAEMVAAGVRVVFDSDGTISVEEPPTEEPSGSSGCGSGALGAVFAVATAYWAL